MALELSEPSSSSSGQKNQEEKRKIDEGAGAGAGAGASGDGDGGGAGAVVEWEWCGDRLSWCPYPASVSSLIEDAFRSKKPFIDFHIGSSSYTVRFETVAHRQINLGTGRCRSVKREISRDGASASWLWFESEKNHWHAYNADLANQIEDAWKENRASRSEFKQDAKAGLYCVIHRQAYVIEFETEAFQVNSKTKFSRNVRRSSYMKQGSSQLPQINGDSKAEATSSPNGIMSPASLLVGGDIASSSSCSVADDALSYIQDHMMDYESPSTDEGCSICLSCLSEKKAVTLVKCNHPFHRECIESWFKCRPSCPECLMIYGTITGTQPPGEMCIRHIAYGSPEARHGLDGYPNTDIIKIIYKFPSGIQGPEHPNPGKPFNGTIRIAYLPKNKDGEEVCELLKKAWNQRLLFRVGMSMTTGQANVVTWATVHHKTHMNGGTSNHGYPDETYFSRVRKELEELGVM